AVRDRDGELRDLDGAAGRRARREPRHRRPGQDCGGLRACGREDLWMTVYELPANLPVPVDDGGAAHLAGLPVPDITLESSNGPVDLATFGSERGVLYIYPRTGRPDQDPPDTWNEIPGARGCTPESCGFRDHSEELRGLGAKIAGLSSQTLEEQVELSERLGILYPVLSDPGLELRDALSLP